MWSAILTFAYQYGPAAVTWVYNNSLWLIPLGYEAIEVIRNMFG